MSKRSFSAIENPPLKRNKTDILNSDSVESIASIKNNIINSPKEYFSKNEILEIIDLVEKISKLRKVEFVETWGYIV